MYVCIHIYAYTYTHTHIYIYIYVYIYIYIYIKSKGPPLACDAMTLDPREGGLPFCQGVLREQRAAWAGVGGRAVPLPFTRPTLSFIGTESEPGRVST